MRTYFSTNHFLFYEGDLPWEPLARLDSLEGLGNIQCSIPEGVILVNPELISIGPETVVEPGAFIKGPCIIGTNCTISHGAYIREQVVMGDRCIIGHATEVKRSIILSDVEAGHFNYIGDSILGNGVQLGAGAKLANYRFDRKEIIVFFNGQEMATGRAKLGAIVGDGAQIGCNAVSSPGTLIGRRAKCFPCTFFSGTIPENGIVKQDQKAEFHGH